MELDLWNVICGARFVELDLWNLRYLQEGCYFSFMEKFVCSKTDAMYFRFGITIIQ